MAQLYQSTRAGKISALRALLIVLGTVLLMLLSDFVLTYLWVKRVIGSSRLREIILVGIAATAFLYLFTHYSLVSVYEMDGMKITFSRIYIKNPRLMEQVLLRELVYFGTPEEASARYQCESRKRFVSARCEQPEMQLVYKRGSLFYGIVFCPNEEIKSALITALKEH